MKVLACRHLHVESPTHINYRLQKGRLHFFDDQQKSIEIYKVSKPGIRVLKGLSAFFQRLMGKAHQIQISKNGPKFTVNTKSCAKFLARITPGIGIVVERQNGKYSLVSKGKEGYKPTLGQLNAVANNIYQYFEGDSSGRNSLLRHPERYIALQLSTQFGIQEFVQLRSVDHYDSRAKDTNGTVYTYSYIPNLNTASNPMFSLITRVKRHFNRMFYLDLTFRKRSVDGGESQPSVNGGELQLSVNGGELQPSVNGGELQPSVNGTESQSFEFKYFADESPSSTELELQEVKPTAASLRRVDSTDSFKSALSFSIQADD